MKLAAAKMENYLEGGGKTKLMWGLSLLKLGWVEGFGLFRVFLAQSLT